LDRYKDVISFSEYDLGSTILVQYRIETEDAPFKSAAYRVPVVMKEKIVRQVGQLKEHGIIEDSYGPWSSPVVLLKKKDGSY
jgi:hypothetical protein